MHNRSFLKRHTALLSRRPLIVGTLAGGPGFAGQLRHAQKAPCDLLELRLDGFPQVAGEGGAGFAQTLLATIRAKTAKPLLLTLRSQREQGIRRGGVALSDGERKKLFAALLTSVDMIDVEIRHTLLATALTHLAHRKKVDVIHSYHDFGGPGSLPALTHWSRLSKQLGGDVFKVAVTPHTNDQLEAFLRWGQTLSNPNVCLIGMGEVGLISRCVAFGFGSVLTYGHLGTSTAPGQMAVADLARSLKSIYAA